MGLVPLEHPPPGPSPGSQMPPSPGTGGRGCQWDPAGPGHRARQTPALAAATLRAGHSPSQQGLRGDADALQGTSPSPQDAQGRAAALVLRGAAEAEGAQQQPQVEQDAGPAGGHLHPEGRPAAVREGGLQHRVLVAGGRGQALGAQGMLTRDPSTRCSRQVTPCPSSCVSPGTSHLPWGPADPSPISLQSVAAVGRGCWAKQCGSAGAEPCASPAGISLVLLARPRAGGQ